jgi:hypothetical protein
MMRVVVPLAQSGVVGMSRICSLATSESRAGNSVLHRTATAFFTPALARLAARA